MVLKHISFPSARFGQTAEPGAAGLGAPSRKTADTELTLQPPPCSRAGSPEEAVTAEPHPDNPSLAGPSPTGLLQLHLLHTDHFCPVSTTEKLCLFQLFPELS